MKTSTNAVKILAFLKEENKAFCDDCLSNTLGISPRQQVNQICRGLQARKRIIRERGNCTACGKYKIVNCIGRIEEAQAVHKAVLFDEEERMREIMSGYLGIPLSKEKLSIFGKEKEFDLVNIEAKWLGTLNHTGIRVLHLLLSSALYANMFG
jgi:hypothetical protein